MVVNNKELDYHKATLDRVKKYGCWYSISDNKKISADNPKGKDVFSCRDAVQSRDRLGSGDNGGVPLWVELKSQIYSYNTPHTHKTAYIVAHTRANTRFDEKNILKTLLLNEHDISLNPIEGEEEMGDKKSQSNSSIFGLVNPFNIDALLITSGYIKNSEEITQIFDNSLLLHGGYPNTVITNAGDRSKSIEVYPHDLIDCIQQYFSSVYTAEISNPDPIWLGQDGDYIKDEWARFPPPMGPKIGILTGNSPESGAALWNDFLLQYRKYYNNLADVLMPEIIVHSLPQMGLSMELVKREKPVWEAIKSAITEMLNDGCKLITIACNTTIYFEPQIQELCTSFNARFVSIAEACLPVVQKHAGKDAKIGLVGIGTVIDFDGGYSGYQRQFKDHGISVIPCDAEDLAYLIKSVGTSPDGLKSIVQKFRKLMSHELKDANIVVLSLTEVSLIYREHIATSPKSFKSRKVFIDPVFELARYLVFLYLVQGLKESKACQIPEDFDVEEKLNKIIYADNT